MLRQDLALWYRMPSDWYSPCLTFPSARIIGIHHKPQIQKFIFHSRSTASKAVARDRSTRERQGNGSFEENLSSLHEVVGK